jgi:hypothetical protein
MSEGSEIGHGGLLCPMGAATSCGFGGGPHGGAVLLKPTSKRAKTTSVGGQSMESKDEEVAEARSIAAILSVD